MRHSIQSLGNLARAAALLTSLAATAVFASCPLNANLAGAAAGVGTTDGLIFLRYGMGMPAAVQTENAIEPGAIAGSGDAYIKSVGLALDIDGDSAVTPFDMMVIARYLYGFRGDALTNGLQVTAGAQRVGGAALQAFIESGCPTSNDPRVSVWNAMNAQLALGTNASIDAAKEYMTDTAVENYGVALRLIAPDLAALVASYSPLLLRDESSNYAEYLVAIPVAGSTNGARRVHVITFLKVDDGSWRVDAM